MWEPSIAARDWNGGPLSSSARRSFLVLVMLHFLLNGTASVISSQRSHRLFTEDPDDDDLMENKKRGLVVAEEWQYEQIGPTLVSPYYHNVAVSGDGRRLVVGDDTHDNSRGRVTIYELNEDGNVWEEVGNFSGLVEGDKLSRRGSLLMGIEYLPAPKTMVMTSIIGTQKTGIMSSYSIEILRDGLSGQA